MYFNGFLVFVPVQVIAKCFCSCPGSGYSQCDYTITYKRGSTNLLTPYFVSHKRTHHYPIVWVVEPLEQLHGGGLAAAGRPDQSEHLSRLYDEIQPLQDGHSGAGRVVKQHRFKLDRAIHLTLQEKKIETQVVIWGFKN